jgi:hypothetical protein
LTFKSIDAILDGEVGDNAHRFLPALDPDQAHSREIIMTPALHDWCYEQDSNKSLNYKANLRAFLKRFVIGLPVDNDDYFKNWRRRIFEVRLQLAPPKSDNTRIFGAFMRQDVFVAAHQKPRAWFVGRTERWDQAIAEAESKLQAMFPGVALLLPCPFSNCVSHNAIDLSCGEEP